MFRFIKWIKAWFAPRTPWRWGFEDGCKGVDLYNGYQYFVGKDLDDYQRGWKYAGGKEKCRCPK